MQDSIRLRSLGLAVTALAFLALPACQTAPPRTTAGNPAMPQAHQNPDRTGSWEVTAGGAGSNDEDFEAGGGQLAGSVGYFLTDDLQLVGRQNLAFFEPGPGAPDVWNGSTRAALDLHLTDGPLVPFIGANFGWVYGDTVQETMAAAPEVGLKWYVRPDAFLQAIGEYQFFFKDTDQLDTAVENGNFVYGFAIGLRF